MQNEHPDPMDNILRAENEIGQDEYQDAGKQVVEGNPLQEKVTR